MDWFKGVVKNVSGKKNTHRKASVSQDKRFFVRPSDKRVVTAYKKPDGPGYVYHKRGPSGIRNVSINGPTHKKEKDAKLKYTNQIVSIVPIYLIF